MKFLYIIKKGVVKITKRSLKPKTNIALRNNTSSSSSDDSDVDLFAEGGDGGAKAREVPGLWVLQKNWRDNLGKFIYIYI